MALAACLLGTHIGSRASEPRPFSRFRFFQRQSEVDEKWSAFRIKQDVPRLDVTMDKPLLVRN